MEKLCKVYLMFAVSGMMSLGALASAATPATAQLAVPQQKLSPEEQDQIAENFAKTCDRQSPTYNKFKCEGLRIQQGAPSGGVCEDTNAKSAFDELKKAEAEAKKMCASAIGASSSGDLSQCTEKIKECDELKSEVNSLDKEETKSTDHTDSVTQLANNSMLRSMGIQIPSTKKTEPLTPEEKEYFEKCPLLSDEQYQTQLKANEDKRDKIKEDIAKKKKEVIEAMAKSSKDMDEYNKKKSERAERARKDKSEYEKEIQRINQDHNKQTAELMKAEAETIKQRNNVDAEYNTLEQMRRKLATDLSGISVELSGVCKGKYHELLQKSLGNSNRRVGSASGAVEARDYKLAFLKRCVRDQWFEVKQKYDKIKAELVSMRQEKDNARKQLAAINNEKSNMIAMKARQDQAVQSGEQDRMSAAAQLEQEMIQGAQRGIQQNQQTSMNLQNEISTLEATEGKIEQRIQAMGKKPSGKHTLADASSAVDELRSRTETAEGMISSAATTGLSDGCVGHLETAVNPARTALNKLNNATQNERAVASEQKKNDAKAKQ